MHTKRRAIPFLTATALVVIFGAIPHAVSAQENEELSKQAQEVIASAQPIHIQATITGIDPASRMVMIHGPRGDASVIVSKDVTNFDQLRVGDKVDVLYKNALLVTAEKVSANGKGVRSRVDTQSITPASGPGGTSGFESSRRVEILATVEKIDNKRHTITLRGPWRTETLDFGPALEAQKLKKGDTVHAVFVSAAAVKVTPASEASAAQ
ncbi:hypothetical protein P9239_05215 [Caballeronia sp. LZ062]|uniref:hypothetical protein n=1 Tax=unclassified Caballeronia TaxID=2646786 RepID=UPI002857419D|nr:MULTISPECIES: hypothetical protein [unclassified Caballeronia]MDR5856845.1 hypothetical protein [Caballeronia sp. LZ050]MDR5869758.1 hypothetical protein [Caballeronia sp. LZ062]